MEKKNLHFVFQAYLRRWGTPYKRMVEDHKQEFYKIFRIRRGTHNYEIDEPDVNNIASENYFYQFMVLNDKEKNFLKSLIKNKKFKSEFDELVKSNESILDFEELISKIENSKLIMITSKIKDAVDNILNLIKKTKTELIEEYFRDSEDRIAKITSDIVNNENFVFNKSNVSNVVRDILIQFFRTKKAKIKYEELINNIDTKEGIRVEATFPYFVITQANDLAYGVLKKYHNITILHNETEKSYITSDSPVIMVEDNGPFIYYPISPKIALLVNNTTELKRKATISEVESFNSLVIENQFKELYVNDCQLAISICKELNSEMEEK